MTHNHSTHPKKKCYTCFITEDMISYCVHWLWLITSSSKWMTRCSCGSSSPLFSLLIKSIIRFQNIRIDTNKGTRGLAALANRGQQVPHVPDLYVLWKCSYGQLTTVVMSLLKWLLNCQVSDSRGQPCSSDDNNTCCFETFALKKMSMNHNMYGVSSGDMIV